MGGLFGFCSPTHDTDAAQLGGWSVKPDPAQASTAALGFVLIQVLVFGFHSIRSELAA